jgi:diaminopimelate epimerase
MRFASKMLLKFTKMHGLGNDFIVFDAPGEEVVLDAATFRRLGDRRTGIGFDQALMLTPPRAPGTDVYYRIFNSDGSEVEQCGNGARCIASLVAARLGRRELHMDSPGGRIDARLVADSLVSVNMGVPNFAPASLPFIAEREADRYTLSTALGTVEFGAVSMGNPHAVIRVDAVATAPVDTLGPAVQNHSSFPKQVNVGFMEVIDRSHIRLRVYERGAGETQACGTGACAAVAIGRRWQLLDERVEVEALGGRMTIESHGVNTPIWLTGPAVKSFEGHVTV